MEQKLINTVVGDFSQLNKLLSDGWSISQISAWAIPGGSGCYILLERPNEKV